MESLAFITSLSILKNNKVYAKNWFAVTNKL